MGVLTPEEIAALPPPTAEERAAAALPPKPEGWQPFTGAISLFITPYAYVPRLAPTFHDPENWLNFQDLDRPAAIAALCVRLGRPAEALQVVDRPECRTVEIHGFIRGHDKAVPLALVSIGLTAEDCRRELANLARSAA